MFRRNRPALVRTVSAGTVLAALLAIAAAPAAQQKPLPTAREVIDRSIQAAGGVAALKKIQSMKGKGTFTISEIGGEIEVFAARPNKLLLRATIPALGRIEEGFDGKIAWSIDPMSGPSLVTGRQLVERAEDAWFDLALHEPSQVKSITMIGRETFDNRPAYKLKVIMMSGNDKTEYFDVETGLQIGHEGFTETPMGRVPGTAILRDYQTFNGLKLPTRLIERSLGLEHTIMITSYEFDAVPPATFDLPPAIKALIK